jgi:hypothetical protein
MRKVKTIRENGAKASATSIKTKNMVKRGARRRQPETNKGSGQQQPRSKEQPAEYG